MLWARIVHPAQGVVGPHERPYGRIEHQHSDLVGGLVVWEKGDRTAFDPLECEVQLAEAREFRPKVGREVARALLFDARVRRSTGPGAFVLLTGIPGSGKTTVGGLLARHVLGVHFDFAAAAHEVLGGTPHLEADYRKCGALFDGVVREAIAAGTTIVYDTTAVSASMRAHHFRVAALARRSALVWVRTPKEVCLNRLITERPKSAPDLRPCVRRLTTSFVRTFDDFVDEFEVPESSIVLSGIMDFHRQLLASPFSAEWATV